MTPPSAIDSYFLTNKEIPIQEKIVERQKKTKNNNENTCFFG
jgi:hypothetical protein